MSNPQPPVNNLITFVPGTIAQSAQVNQDFQDIVNLQGNTIGSSLQQVLSVALNGYVQSGGIITTASGLTVNMSAAYLVTSGILYYMPAQAFTVTASKDTYIDFNPANATYTAQNVANGATSPALSTSNATRMGKIVSGASTITSITQTGQDSLGNNIYNMLDYASAFGQATNIPNATTTSASYVNQLSDSLTVQVTVNIGKSGLALLFMNSYMLNSAGDFNFCSIVVSGANTIAVSDNFLLKKFAGSDDCVFGIAVPYSGLNAGLTTFTMQYRVSAGTGTFGQRRLAVLAL